MILGQWCFAVVCCLLLGLLVEPNNPLAFVIGYACGFAAVWGLA